MNKKILFLIFIFILSLSILPGVVKADTKLLAMVNNLATNLKALSAGLATISFIVAGVMFLSATGNPSRLAIAKGALIAAVMGITIIALASVAEIFVKGLFQV